MSMSTLDSPQVIKTVFNAPNSSLNVTPIGGSIINAVYNNIQLSYTGNNLTTVQYYQDLTLVNTLTLTYDGSNNLIEVVKT
jgi:hypothetical protein